MMLNRQALLSMDEESFEKYYRNFLFNSGLELEAMASDPEIPLKITMQKLEEIKTMNEEFSEIFALRKARDKV